MYELIRVIMYDMKSDNYILPLYIFVKIANLEKKPIVLNISDNLMFNTYDVVIKSTVTW
jgi:hypothetical protein